MLACTGLLVASLLGCLRVHLPCGLSLLLRDSAYFPGPLQVFLTLSCGYDVIVHYILSEVSLAGPSS